MNFMNFNLSGPFVKAFGWTLIDSIWQGLIVALLLYIALLLGKKLKAPARYRLSLFALMVTFIWAIFNFNHHYEVYVWQEMQSQLAISDLAMATSDEIPDLSSLSNEKEGVSIFDFQGIYENIERFIPVLFLCWILGTALLTLRFFGGYIYLQKLKTRHLQPLDEHWQNKLAKFKEMLNVKSIINIYESSMINTPITLGYFKPIILIPMGMLTGMSPSQLEALIIHELIHIKRADYLVNLFQSFIEIIMFYHPAIWWISNCVRTEREYCCDDLTVRYCSNPLKYAQALTIIQEKKLLHKPILTMAATNKNGTLTARILRILNLQEHVEQSLKRKLAIGILLLLSLLWFSFSQATEADQKTRTTFNENHAKHSFKLKADQIIVLNKDGINYTTQFIEVEDWKVGHAKILVNGEIFNSIDALNKSGRLDHFEDAEVVYIKFPEKLQDGISGNTYEISSGQYYLKNKHSLSKTSDTKPEASSQLMKPFKIYEENNRNRTTTAKSLESTEKVVQSIFSGVSGKEKAHINRKNKIQKIKLLNETHNKEKSTSGLIGKKKLTEKSVKEPFQKSSKNTTFEIDQTNRSDSTRKPLYILDGEEIGCEGCIQLSDIDANDIENVSVYKHKKAIELIDRYGSKAANGVVVITTKGSNEKTKHPLTKKDHQINKIDSSDFKVIINKPSKKIDMLLKTDPITIYQNTTPNFPSENPTIIGKIGKESLYFMDNIEIKREDLFVNFTTEDIDRIEVLKGKAAIQKYGEKAKNGVVLIFTKKGGVTKKDHNNINGSFKKDNEESIIQNDDLIVYPNPTKNLTNIVFRLKKGTVVSINVYDQAGKMIHTILSDTYLEPVYHQFDWNTKDQPSGIYLIQINKGGKITQQRILVEN